MGKQWKQCQTLFFGAPKSLQMVTAAMKLKDAYSFHVNCISLDFNSCILVLFGSLGNVYDISIFKFFSFPYFVPFALFFFKLRLLF